MLLNNSRCHNWSNTQLRNNTMVWCKDNMCRIERICSKGWMDVIKWELTWCSPTSNTYTTTPNGPMTRSRVKALHEKVTSLLSMCDFDTPLNGLLLQSDTLCVLSHEEREELWGNLDQDGQGMHQDKDEEDGENCQDGLKNQPTAWPRPATIQNQPAWKAGLQPDLKAWPTARPGRPSCKSCNLPLRPRL